MTVGLFPPASAARLLPAVPPSSSTVRFASVDSAHDLPALDLLHLFGTGPECRTLALRARDRQIPLAVSPILPVRTSPVIARIIAAAPAAAGLLSRTPAPFSAAAALCAHASIVFPRSLREARILTRGLGVPERKITVVPPAVDPRYLNADRSLFTRRVPAERFILADGIGGEPERNIPLLLHALAKINHPAVLLLDPVHRSAAAYRSLAAGNPRLHLVDDVTPGSDLYVAAVAAAELVVDVSLDQAGGLAFSAAAVGAKLVVSRTAGWEEYFASDAEYVEPTSWELMHHGITTALNAPEGDALRDRISRECSQAAVLATLERAYRSLS